MKEPLVDYPTILLGYVKGLLRLETNGGGDMYVEHKSNWLVYRKPEWIWNAMYAVTHLQKKSRLGFLIAYPFCFHVWFTFKYQKDGEPGTEIVFYWRIGLWRWDSGDGKWIGPGTWYGPGLHWD